MTWKIDLLAQAERDLSKLDRENARRIHRFLFERLPNLENPRSIGEALQVLSSENSGNTASAIIA